MECSAETTTSTSNTTNERKLILQPIDGLPMAKGCSINRFREATGYQPKKNDVFVGSYHESGTTWVQYIVWELGNRGMEPPFIHEMMFDFGPRIEQLGLQNAIKKSVEDNIVRHFKTHLPFEYTPYSSDAKHVYVTRSPWDVCVSYYRMIKQMPMFYGFQDGTFDDFFLDFIDGWTDSGSYFDHINGWINASKDKSNILLISYEEIKSCPRRGIEKIASFLGDKYEDTSKDSHLMDNILKYTSYEYMKTLPCILPASIEVAKKRMNVGKDVGLVETGEYMTIDFFKEGKSGYGEVHYTNQQKKIMNDKLRHKFHDTLPDILDKWTRE